MVTSFGTGHQMRGVAAQVREDVLDLVEQQRDVAARLQEHLADLRRTVAVAAAQRIGPSRSAYSTSYSARPASRAAILASSVLPVPGGP